MNTDRRTIFLYNPPLVSTGFPFFGFLTSASLSWYFYLTYRQHEPHAPFNNVPVSRAPLPRYATHISRTHDVNISSFKEKKNT